jgi:phosphoesterase RecJ-like protein
MFTPELINQFRIAVNAAQQIGICVHMDPDGDCLGAGIGLGTYLEGQGKTIRYFVPSKIAGVFDFLPEISTFSEHIPSSYTPDLWISVDTATRERSNLRTLATQTPIVHIDHHPTDAPRGTLNLVNDQISSTCEIITYLLKEYGADQITARIATLLFMGISTDTGHFQRGKDLATTFDLASFLLNKWADMSLLVNELYRSHDFVGTKFVGELMQRIVQQDGLIRVSIEQSELEKNYLDEGKIEQLLHIMTGIKHDGIFLLFKHYPDAAQPYLKCSLRTKNPQINVSKIAQQFGWWGHHAAAACRVSGEPIHHLQAAILEYAANFLKQN